MLHQQTNRLKTHSCIWGWADWKINYAWTIDIVIDIVIFIILFVQNILPEILLNRAQ